MDQGQTLKIHPDDNLLVALDDLEAGREISLNGHSAVLRNEIPVKHKLAAADLKSGDQVYLYGTVVGTVTEDIPEGGLLTPENTIHSVLSFSSRAGNPSWQAPDISKWEGQTFMGYHRADGQVGDRKSVV